MQGIGNCIFHMTKKTTTEPEEEQTIGSFTKKPVTITAVKFTATETNYILLKKFMGVDSLHIDGTADDPKLMIHTLEGVMAADKGDMIIKGIRGEFYPCKPDIFKKSYNDAEPVPSEGLTFGQALEALKQEKRVARNGWNGKGMFIFMRPADELNVDFVVDKVKSLPQSVKDYYLQDLLNDKKERVPAEENDNVKFTAYLCMKAADGSIVNGWLASQTDMLSEDWEILD